MAGNDKPPQLTWTNIIATVGVMCVLAAGGYTLVQNQFDFFRQSVRQATDDLAKQIELSRRELELIRAQYLTLREHAAYQQEQENANNAFRGRLTVQEAATRDILSRTARGPVEAKEVDVLSSSIDKRFEAMQQQINDINRQIAAALLVPGVGHVQQPPR